MRGLRLPVGPFAVTVLTPLRDGGALCVGPVVVLGGPGLRSSVRDRRISFNGEMFVGHQVLVNVAFSAALARLANLVHCGVLASASQDAYGEGFTVLAQAGPLRSVPALSKLVDVQVRDLAVGERSAVLALRWQASGPGGAPFPALDADITLAIAGEQATVLKLDGAYRPPPGTVGTRLDRAVLYQVATATVQAFLGRIAEAAAKPVSAAQGENAARSEPGESSPTPTEMP